eukprot:TRINITY_DN1636_c0_g2_i1.p1 TRINITY_DN1636_c0_g2~~TRINITY_DN1636_c0_g2_i1.p1  ORF type:complete len:1400 (-),score=365.19 TRINITY_DN1636_c0_g2_i1:58-4257(-)
MKNSFIPSLLFFCFLTSDVWGVCPTSPQSTSAINLATVLAQGGQGQTGCILEIDVDTEIDDGVALTVSSDFSFLKLKRKNGGGSIARTTFQTAGTSVNFDGLYLIGMDIELNEGVALFSSTTLRDGTSLILQTTKVDFIGCLFINNSLSTNVIYINNPTATPTLSNCEFINNHVPSNSYIILSSSDMHINICNFSGNTGSSVVSALSSTLDILQSSFSNNSLAYPCVASASINCSLTNFYNNTSGNDGGGIYARWAQLTNCTFSHNNSPRGAGVFVTNFVSARDCKFFYNNAESGGGIYSQKDFEIRGCEAYNNNGTTGGAIAVEGNGNITDSYFESNTAYDVGGGAVYCSTNCYLSLASSKFVANRAHPIGIDTYSAMTTGKGGAVYSIGQSYVDVNDVMFYNNRGSNGGAFFGFMNGTANFTENQSIFLGGALGVQCTGAKCIIVNPGTVFKKNWALQGGAVWIGGGLETTTFNGVQFIENGNTSTQVGGVILATGRVNFHNCFFQNNFKILETANPVYITNSTLIENTNNLFQNNGQIFVDNSTFVSNLPPFNNAMFTAKNISIKNSFFRNNGRSGSTGSIARPANLGSYLHLENNIFYDNNGVAHVRTAVPTTIYNCTSDRNGGTPFWSQYNIDINISHLGCDQVTAIGNLTVNGRNIKPTYNYTSLPLIDADYILGVDAVPTEGGSFTYDAQDLLQDFSSTPAGYNCSYTGVGKKVMCTIPPGIGKNLKFKSAYAGLMCFKSDLSFSYDRPSISHLLAANRIINVFGKNFGSEAASIFVNVTSTLGQNSSCNVLSIVSTTQIRIQCDESSISSMTISVGSQIGTYTTIAPPNLITEDQLGSTVIGLLNSTGVSASLNSIVAKVFLNASATNPIVFSSTNISLSAFDLRRQNGSEVSLSVTSSKEGQSSIPSSVLEGLASQRRESNDSVPAYVVFSSYDGAFNQFVLRDESQKPSFSSKVYGLSVVDSEGQVIEVVDADDPISIVMSIEGQLNETQLSSLQCLYWDEKNSIWSSDGCTGRVIESARFECLCSHLTNFTSGIVPTKPTSAVIQTNKNNNGSTFPLGAIIGIAVGGFVLIAIMVLLVAFLIRRSKRNLNEVEMGLSGGFDLDKRLESRIEIKETLGTGAFSVVYRGVQSGTTDVAVKKLNLSVDKRQFIRESNILKSLHHPNIIQYLGLYQDAGNQLCMVVEFMKAGDLLGLLQRESLPLSFKYKILLDLTSSIVYIHEQGIVHADISARNVLVSGNLVKLSDFGMSREVNSSQSSFVGDKNPVRWSAPEVLEQQKYSFESDVWSFGVLIWEVLNDGKVPYGSKDNNQVIRFVTEGGRLSTEGLDSSLEAVVNKSWEIKPKDRATLKNVSVVLSSLITTENSSLHDDTSAADYNNSVGDMIYTSRIQ